MSIDTATVVPGSPVMNKKLGFGAMVASATGMGMVGFFSRGAVPTHMVDGETVKYVLATSSCHPEWSIRWPSSVCLTVLNSVSLSSPDWVVRGTIGPC